MKKIGFVGLGNMGGPMAANLVKAGFEVTGYDLAAANLDAAAKAGVRPAAGLAEAVRAADAVVTMLPAGAHVRAVYQNAGGILESVPRGALLIDSSTIDVASARAVASAAQEAGMDMLDAPVSGG